MRNWLTMILFILILPVASFAAKPIDIILDIDWTAFYTVLDGERDVHSVDVEGKVYRPTDHLTETIEWLLKNHPEVRISFFSGGERSRNETLLSMIHLSDGRSLKDISFQIFSKEHLFIASHDEKLKFAERYKKSITGLIPDWNPERSILIDDQVAFAKPPLKAVFSLGNLNFQRAFNPQKSGESYFPANENQWSLERNKALIWAARLESAFIESSSGKFNFAQAVQSAWETLPLSEISERQGARLIRPYSAKSCGKIFAF